MAASTKKTNQDRIKEITDSIESGIRELFESERFQSYLSTMSRFHRYSVNNQILIHMQRPNATYVAGFNAWRDKFGRHVRKGEKGIQILAPTPVQKRIKETVRDPDTKAPLHDENGNVMTEERTVVTVPHFKPVSVFDVSQTEGKALPQLALPLTGDVEHFEAFVEALRRSAPVPIAFESMASTTDGYFSETQQRIAIRENMSQVQTVSAMIHEIAHSMLHNYDRLQAEATEASGRTPEKKDRRTEEVEAESVSYAVCQYYGIETAENSFGYIAAWSKSKELKELKASLNTVSKTVSSLIADIDRNLAEIRKERGLDQKKEAVAEEVTAEAPKEEPPDPYLAYSTSLLDYVEELHHDGLIPDPFTNHEKPETAEMYADLLRREGLKHAQSVLDDYEIRSGRPTPEQLQAQLDALKTLWDSGLTYELHLSPIDLNSGYISSYTPDGNVFEGTLFSGPTAVCEKLLAELRDGVTTPEQVRAINRQMEDLDTFELPAKLDEYPLPDSTAVPDALVKAGCKDTDTLLPLNRDRAAELFADGFSIYMIDENGEPLMCMDEADLTDAGEKQLLLAVDRWEWEKSPDFRVLVRDQRIERQADREAAFLNYPADAFAVYQISGKSPERRERAFMDLASLREQGMRPAREHYDLIYTGSIAKHPSVTNPESAFRVFNLERPNDFGGHSLSVSDIVAFRRNGVVVYHYCDSIGFEELSEFQKPENYLKNAEMAFEDDYSMIDGIINNGKKEPPKQPERPSLRARLREESGQPEQQGKKENPRREDRSV